MLRIHLEKDFGGDLDGDDFCFLVWKRLLKGNFEADVDGDLNADGDLILDVLLCQIVKSSSREIVKSSSCQKTSRPKSSRQVVKSSSCQVVKLSMFSIVAVLHLDVFCCMERDVVGKC